MMDTPKMDASILTIAILGGVTISASMLSTPIMGELKMDVPTMDTLTMNVSIVS
jgi:hypothetical protein